MPASIFTISRSTLPRFSGERLASIRLRALDRKRFKNLSTATGCSTFFRRPDPERGAQDERDASRDHGWTEEQSPPAAVRKAIDQKPAEPGAGAGSEDGARCAHARRCGWQPVDAVEEGGQPRQHRPRDEDQHSARRIRCEDAARPEHLCHAFEEARLASSAARLATPPVKA
jgi:hypothetical protein